MEGHTILPQVGPAYSPIEINGLGGIFDYGKLDGWKCQAEHIEFDRFTKADEHLSRLDLRIWWRR